MRGNAHLSDETRRRVYMARGPDGHEKPAGRKGATNALQFEGHFPEPDDVGTQSRLPAAQAFAIRMYILLPLSDETTSQATDLSQFSMHVDQVLVPRPIMEIINVLCDE